MNTPLPVSTGRGLSVRYRDRNLYNSENPVVRSEEAAARVVIRPDTLVIVPSPVLGYGLDVLLRKLESGCRILCIETDQNLMALSMEHIPPEILHHERLSMIRTESPVEAVRFVERLGFWNFRRIETVRLSGGYALSAQAYRGMIDAIGIEIRRYWRNRMTTIRMGRLWVRNILANLPALGSGTDIASLRVDKPVVVAGAGESLESAFVWLREVRELVFLVSVDTALPSLVEAGFTPDLVVALESQIANQADFIGLFDLPCELACDISSYPGIVRRYPGRCRFFMTRFERLGIFERLEEAGLAPAQIPPLGSVGLAAIRLATEITDRPILLTGLDFAYTAGKPHAKHAPSHTMYLYRANRLNPDPLFAAGTARQRLEAAGAHGRTITTDAVLGSYAELAREMLAGEVDVADARSSGLDLGLRTFSGPDEVIRFVNEAAAEPFRDAVGRAEDGKTGGAGARAGERADQTPADRAAARTTNGGSDPADGAVSAEDKLYRILRFLRNEETLLCELLELGKGLLASGGPDERTFPARLLSLLRELDYLYIDFPDRPPLPAENRPFIARALARAQYCLERVRRSIGLAAGRIATPRSS